MGWDAGSEQRLDELRGGINEIASSLQPTRLSNGDPTAALFSLASGFDEEQKRYLLRVIDELDTENQTLLHQLTEVRDTAVHAANQTITGADYSTATAPPTPMKSSPVSIAVSEVNERQQAARELATIEEELAEAARTGVRLRNPIPQTNLGPLAAATADLATKFGAFSNGTSLGQVRV